MDRISGLNNLIVAGKRMWQDRNLIAGTQGTLGNALWFDGAQESILGPVEAAGIVPSDADNTQLLQAIRIFSGSNITVFAAGTYGLTASNAGLCMVDASGGNVVLNLPVIVAAPSYALHFEIVRTDASTNAVTINSGAGDNFLPGGFSSVPLMAGMRVVFTTVNAGQWLAAGRSLGVAGLVAWTGSGSFTVPAGCATVDLEIWGGGGGGGAGGSGAGGGGGGAGYQRGSYAVSQGQTYTVTVGSTGVSGAPGGTSSFGSLASASGGGGASTGTSSGYASGGTPGNGYGSPSSMIVAGTTGLAGGADNYSGWISGNGGTAFGSSLLNYGSGSVANGNGGAFPGGGGGGAILGGVGGPGGHGLVLARFMP